MHFTLQWSVFFDPMKKYIYPKTEIILHWAKKTIIASEFHRQMKVKDK